MKFSDSGAFFGGLHSPICLFMEVIMTNFSCCKDFLPGMQRKDCSVFFHPKQIVLCDAVFHTKILFSSVIAPGKFQSCFLAWHIWLVVLLILLLADMLLKRLATLVRNQVSHVIPGQNTKLCRMLYAEYGPVNLPHSGASFLC